MTCNELEMPFVLVYHLLSNHVVLTVISYHFLSVLNQCVQ